MDASRENIRTVLDVTPCASGAVVAEAFLQYCESRLGKVVRFRFLLDNAVKLD